MSQHLDKVTHAVIKGFRSISTIQGRTSLTGSTVRDIYAALHNFEKTYHIEDYGKALHKLEKHLVQENPHSLSELTMDKDLLSTLYDHYREYGYTGTFEDMRKSIFQDIHLSDPKDIDVDTDNGHVLTPYTFYYGFVQQHENSASEAHKNIIDELFPGIPIVQAPDDIITPLHHIPETVKYPQVNNWYTNKCGNHIKNTNDVCVDYSLCGYAGIPIYPSSHNSVSSLGTIGMDVVDNTYTSDDTLGEHCIEVQHNINTDDGWTLAFNISNHTHNIFCITVGDTVVAVCSNNRLVSSIEGYAVQGYTSYNSTRIALYGKPELKDHIRIYALDKDGHTQHKEHIEWTVTDISITPHLYLPCPLGYNESYAETSLTYPLYGVNPYEGAIVLQRTPIVSVDDKCIATTLFQWKDGKHTYRYHLENTHLILYSDNNALHTWTCTNSFKSMLYIGWVYTDDTWTLYLDDVAYEYVKAHSIEEFKEFTCEFPYTSKCHLVKLMYYPSALSKEQYIFGVL